MAADSTTPGTPPGFIVTENARQVGELTVGAPSAASSIVLAIDTSGSMKGGPIKEALAAAGEFLASVKQGDQVAIVNFGHTASVAQPLTADTGALATALASLGSDPQSGTALNDAVAIGIKELATAPVASRRVLIVMTDGKDSSSLVTMKEVAKQAVDNQVAVYPIALRSTQFSPDVLQQLAGATGGSFRDAEKGGLAGVYGAVADELAKTYVLSFRSSESERVEVAVSADGVIAKTGYAAGAAPTVRTDSGLIPKRVTHSAWSSFALAALVFGLILVGFALIFRPRPQRTLAKQLEGYTEFSKRKLDEDSNERVALHVRLARSTEKVLGGLQFWKNTALLIERSDLPLRTGEVFYMQLGAALLLAAPAGLMGVFPLFTLLLFALGFFLPVLWLKLKARKRQKAFGDQLPDTLVAMAASLKAGHSWNQAMETRDPRGRRADQPRVRPRCQRGPPRPAERRRHAGHGRAPGVDRLRVRRDERQHPAPGRRLAGRPARPGRRHGAPAAAVPPQGQGAQRHGPHVGLHAGRAAVRDGARHLRSSARTTSRRCGRPAPATCSSSGAVLDHDRRPDPEERSSPSRCEQTMLIVVVILVALATYFLLQGITAGQRQVAVSLRRAKTYGGYSPARGRARQERQRPRRRPRRPPARVAGPAGDAEGLLEETRRKLIAAGKTNANPTTYLAGKAGRVGLFLLFALVLLRRPAARPPPCSSSCSAASPARS